MPQTVDCSVCAGVDEAMVLHIGVDRTAGLVDMQYTVFIAVI